MKNFVKWFGIAFAALIVIACLASCGEGGTVIIQNATNRELTGVFVIPGDHDTSEELQNTWPYNQPKNVVFEHEGAVSIPAGESRSFAVRTDPSNSRSSGSPWFWVFIRKRWYSRVFVSHDETVTVRIE